MQKLALLAAATLLGLAAACNPADSVSDAKDGAAHEYH